MEAALAPSTIETAKAPVLRSQTRPLYLNAYWTLAGNAISVGSQGCTLIALAKLGSAENVGQFALATAVVTPLLLLSNIALRELVSTDANRKYHFSEYITVRYLTTSIAMMVALVLACTAGYGGATTSIIIAIAFAKSVDSISDITQGYLQQNDSFDLVAIFRGVAGLINFATVAAGLLLTGSFLVTVYLLAAVSIVRVVAWEIPAIHSRFGDAFTCRPSWNHKHLSELFKQMVPLGIVSMMLSLNSNLPRYFLGHFQGETELGVFTAIAYLPAVGSQFMDAVGKASAPKLSVQFATGENRSFFGLLAKLSLLGSVAGVAATVISHSYGHQIISIIYSVEIAMYASLLPLLMIGTSINFVAGFLGIGLTASRYFKVLPIIGAVVLASQLAASFILIPSGGVKGAAWSLILGASCNLLASVACLAMLSASKSQKTADTRCNI